MVKHKLRPPQDHPPWYQGGQHPFGRKFRG